MEKVSLLDSYLKSAGVNSSFKQVVNKEMIRQNIPEIWDETQGEGIKIAVLDTGCQCDHVDLTGSINYKYNIVKIKKLERFYQIIKYYKKKKKKYINKRASSNNKSKYDRKIAYSQKQIDFVVKKV